MFTAIRSPLRTTTSRYISNNLLLIRGLQTQTQPQVTRKEGDISSVFVSLSGLTPEPLPQRFADIKRQLIKGKEAAITASWKRLLPQLSSEIEVVKQKGPSIIPSIQFKDLSNPPEEFVKDLRKRGVAVIRGVVPEAEARGYKSEVEKYVKANPSTKAFPPHDPQVFELYWSPPQLRARAHSNLLRTQTSLMKIWHSSSTHALLSTSQPLSYADRLRIRQPGDSQFALGPHIDGGSVERWEPHGYGLGDVYSKIFEGKWEDYDPWESSCRIPVKSDKYQGAGSCSMFRMFQGWLGLSCTGPGEGTLMVNPMLRMATAYFLLRPFFEPVRVEGREFLRAENWRLMMGEEVDSKLHGASPGHGQELNEVLHPHLDLGASMVHVPEIRPGDYVVWHCDTIHAVDKKHEGKGDSSVMYVPVCPTTEANAEYLARQRDTFLEGYPGPDFPGGKGESEHVGRPGAEYVAQHGNDDALRSMGLAKLKQMDWEKGDGAKEVIEGANQVLGFA